MVELQIGRGSTLDTSCAITSPDFVPHALRDRRSSWAGRGFGSGQSDPGSMFLENLLHLNSEFFRDSLTQRLRANMLSSINQRRRILEPRERQERYKVRLVREGRWPLAHPKKQDGHRMDGAVCWKCGPSAAIL